MIAKLNIADYIVVMRQKCLACGGDGIESINEWPYLKTCSSCAGPGTVPVDVSLAEFAELLRQLDQLVEVKVYEHH